MLMPRIMSRNNAANDALCKEFLEQPHVETKLSNVFVFFLNQGGTQSFFYQQAELFVFCYG